MWKALGASAGVIALLTLVFTSGKTYSSMSGQIESLSDRVEQLESRPSDNPNQIRREELAELAQQVNQIEEEIEKKFVAVQVIELAGKGVALSTKEFDGPVDKRYFPAVCKEGDISVAKINATNKGNQAAICFCTSSPENKKGKGWYCFD